MTGRRVLLILVSAVLAVALLGGGYAWGRLAGSSSPSLADASDRASATAHNADDVRFASMMVPHHTQAIEMAKLAATRAGSAEVKALAARIAEAQGPEISKMNAWLDAWGAEVGGGRAMTGMMSAKDMSSLADTSGRAFDKAFLTMMVQHHSGAVTMASHELKDGRNGDALALAASILVSQRAEIREMRSMLD